MPIRPAAETDETRSSHPVEDIACAYLSATQGDADLALRRAIADALFDILEAEHRARESRRSVSRGFVRARAEA